VLISVIKLHRESLKSADKHKGAQFPNPPASYTRNSDIDFAYYILTSSSDTTSRASPLINGAETNSDISATLAGGCDRFEML
jgi:hypothetical protein